MDENHNKIVIVDDDPDMYRLVQMKLEESGYQVQVANDGISGLALVQKEKPSMAILDVMMPGMNGYMICRKLKDDPDCKNIPVLLLTGRSTESDQFWGIEAGADGYITKPFNVDEVLAKVEELIQK